MTDLSARLPVVGAPPARCARLPISLLLLAPLIGCGEVRQRTSPRAHEGPGYEQDIQPLLAGRCIRCHSGETPAGNYDLSSYPGLLGPGQDLTRNAIAGDPQSRLLRQLDPTQHPEHFAYLLPRGEELAEGESAVARREADLQLLRTWVVDKRLAYFFVLVHPPGWVYPEDRSDPSFHGGSLRQHGWNMDPCRDCHGQDLRGGSGPTCRSCHAQGPTACTTCHGSAQRSGASASAPPPDLEWQLSPAAPGVGAHQVHLRQSPLWGEIACGDCHLVPRTWTDPGHLFDDPESEQSDLSAELTFSEAAALDEVTPVYERSSQSCRVYCHGVSLQNPGNQTTPSWTLSSARASQSGTCGTCHQLGHQQPRLVGDPNCALCHQQSVAFCLPQASEPSCLPTAAGAGVSFASLADHGDGDPDLGRDSELPLCARCHGTAASQGAPAPDLRGNTPLNIVTVGLHELHLQSPTLGSPVACDSCHIRPQSLLAAGHLDTSWPAEVRFDELASGAVRGVYLGLNPRWDRKTATCSDIYCHALQGGSVDQWSWTVRLEQELDCASCHGMPPAQTLRGYPHPDSGECQLCHGSAYTAEGRLDPEQHINGRVNR